MFSEMHTAQSPPGAGTQMDGMGGRQLPSFSVGWHLTGSDCLGWVAKSLLLEPVGLTYSWTLWLPSHVTLGKLTLSQFPNL